MRTALAALAVVLAAPCLAADPPTAAYSRTYSDCLDHSPSTVEILDCVAAEQTDWDSKLDSSYRELMTKLAPEGRIRLRQEERLWLRRRDSRCAHAGDDEAGGSLQKVEISQCYLDQTIRRALLLRSYSAKP